MTGISMQGADCSRDIPPAVLPASAWAWRLARARTVHEFKAEKSRNLEVEKYDRSYSVGNWDLVLTKLDLNALLSRIAVPSVDDWSTSSCCATLTLSLLAWGSEGRDPASAVPSRGTGNFNQFVERGPHVVLRLSLTWIHLVQPSDVWSTL